METLEDQLSLLFQPPLSIPVVRNMLRHWVELSDLFFVKTIPSLVLTEIFSSR